jgi:O-methyltransferase involved in polyketide biosynthesis
MEKIDQRKEEDDETQREKEKNGAIFTAFDSLDSKFQSSKIGYFQDNFLDRMHDELMRKGLRPAKRPPIINKGYYIRILAFQRTISSFINASNGNIQLIFLGCGYDPFPLKLLQEWSTIRVDEADYPEVIENKRNIYSSWGESGQFLPHLFEVDLNEGEHLITTLTNNLNAFCLPYKQSKEV